MKKVMRSLILIALIVCVGCENYTEDRARIPEVRQEGREAQKNGLKLTDNPYPSNRTSSKVFLYAEWNKGYNESLVASRNVPD